MSSRIEDAEISSMVADQAERFFGDFVTKEVLTDADAGNWQIQLWNEIAQAGFPLAYIREALGGIGLPAADAFALIRRAAYHALPLPLGETMLARALWQIVQEDAWTDPDPLAPWTLPVDPEGRLSLCKTGGEWSISGTASCVPWGNEAQTLLAVATDESGVSHLVALPFNADCASLHKTLANEPRAEFHLDAVRVPTDAVRPASGFIARHGLKHYCALMRCHQMVGAMQRSLEYALIYAKDRVQFGQPIAKMPAVQALLVHAAAQSAAASAATDLATLHFDASLDDTANHDFDFVTALAKSRVGEAAGEVAAACHQVHGAMGFTQEHPLHFFTRRLWSWRDEAGGEGFWQKRIGDGVCAKGGDALWPFLTAF